MTDLPSEIDGRSSAITAWRTLLLALGDLQPRRVWLVDPDFAAWPFGDAAVIDAMSAWIRSGGRRMTWIGADFAAVERSHPRLVPWRRQYAHAIDAYRPVEGEQVDWPSWLILERTALVLDDRERWRGRTLTEPQRLRELCEAADALLQRCEPAWPGTTLGL
jgi:hypothetical protein